MSLREELKNIEVGLFLYNIDTYQEKLQKIIEDDEILKSQNEDIELEDVMINYYSAELVYNSSISAASKVVRQSLLDFL